MAEEPKHLNEVKWPKKCEQCGDMVDKTGWLYNHKLYCEKHKPVPTDTTNPPEEQKNTPSSKVRCENCGGMVDHVTRIIRIGNADVNLSICDDCEWLRVASWNLKLHGMWRPMPRPTEEAKA